jgi:hypothetical protein
MLPPLLSQDRTHELSPFSRLIGPPGRFVQQCLGVFEVSGVP